MTILKLYHFPNACSRVSMTALEHIGIPFEDELVDLLAGDHKKPDYPNPRAKVPALLVDGKLLTENAAILSWLDMTYPDAGLLPKPANDFERAQILSDLFWVSSVWHPSIRANAVPMAWTTGDTAPVRERGKMLFTPCIEMLEARLADAEWWLGIWSIIDVYMCWAYTRAEQGEFDLSPYPNVRRHRAAVEALPAFQRALAREQAAKARSETA